MTILLSAVSPFLFSINALAQDQIETQGQPLKDTTLVDQSSGKKAVDIKPKKLSETKKSSNPSKIKECRDKSLKKDEHCQANELLL